MCILLVLNIFHPEFPALIFCYQNSAFFSNLTYISFEMIKYIQVASDLILRLDMKSEKKVRAKSEIYSFSPHPNDGCSPF